MEKPGTTETNTGTWKSRETTETKANTVRKEEGDVNIVQTEPR